MGVRDAEEVEGRSSEERSPRAKGAGALGRRRLTGFQLFRAGEAPSWEDVCADLFRRNRGTIRIKKERVAVRNLQRLLPAALRLSRVKGFHAMTLRELGREAGLSTGVLYSCFPSKKALQDLLLEEGVDFTVRYLRDRIRKVGDPAGRLREAIRIHIYLSELFGPWFYFLYMEARNLSPEEKRKAMKNEEATERIFHEILRERMEAGGFAGDDRLVAAAIKALLQDWYLKRWKYRKLSVSPDEYAEFVAALVEAYMLPRMDSRPSSVFQPGEPQVR